MVLVHVIVEVARWLYVNTPGNLAASAICVFAAWGWAQTRYWPLNLLHRKLDRLERSHRQLHEKLDQHRQLHERHARRLDAIARRLPPP